MQDRRCRFGLAARIEMIKRRQAGESLRSIAASLACSPTTVRINWLLSDPFAPLACGPQATAPHSARLLRRHPGGSAMPIPPIPSRGLKPAALPLPAARRGRRCVIRRRA